MGYVIAAYGIAIGSVALYLLRLAHEERALVRALAATDPAATPGAAGRPASNAG